MGLQKSRIHAGGHRAGPRQTDHHHALTMQKEACKNPIQDQHPGNHINTKKRMKLYRISQTENIGYDSYDSAVVLAKNFIDAKNTNPRTGQQMRMRDWVDNYYWCSKLEDVKVEYLGEAKYEQEDPIIVASFNAG